MCIHRGCPLNSGVCSHSCVQLIYGMPIQTGRLGRVWGNYKLSMFNSLAPERSECDFKNVILNLALLIGIFKFSYDNIPR